MTKKKNGQEAIDREETERRPQRPTPTVTARLLLSSREPLKPTSDATTETQPAAMMT